jgi:hypothetical protein
VTGEGKHCIKQIEWNRIIVTIIVIAVIRIIIIQKLNWITITVMINNLFLNLDNLNLRVFSLFLFVLSE